MSEILYSRLGGYDAIAVTDDLLDGPSQRRGRAGSRSTRPFLSEARN
jgi:hypothetical protein